MILSHQVHKGLFQLNKVKLENPNKDNVIKNYLKQLSIYQE